MNGYLTPGLNYPRKTFNCWCVVILTVQMIVRSMEKGQPCEAGWQKLNSQLSILVDKSNAVNSFISPSDEENTNKKWMWSRMRQMKRLECRFAVYSIACLMLKKKAISTILPICKLTSRSIKFSSWINAPLKVRFLNKRPRHLFE